MGLCKCKNVTSQFCFEHRKNVCCDCVESDHQICTVDGYLRWLQDSNFNPNCLLCKKSFSVDKGDFVRLECFHLFHWSCLQAEFDAQNIDDLSKATCPLCKKRFISLNQSDLENSKLLLRLNNKIAKLPSKWQAQFQEIAEAAKSEDKDFGRGKPTAQPNGMVAIEVGDQAQILAQSPGEHKRQKPFLKLFSIFSKYSRIGSDCKNGGGEEENGKGCLGHARGILSILKNFVMLRNVRRLNFGSSPRFTVMAIAGMFVLFIFLIWMATPKIVVQ